jgi:hypothetical protein
MKNYIDQSEQFDKLGQYRKSDYMLKIAIGNYKRPDMLTQQLQEMGSGFSGSYGEPPSFFMRGAKLNFKEAKNSKGMFIKMPDMLLNAKTVGRASYRSTGNNNVVEMLERNISGALNPSEIAKIPCVFLKNPKILVNYNSNLNDIEICKKSLKQVVDEICDIGNLEKINFYNRKMNTMETIERFRMYIENNIIPNIQNIYDNQTNKKIKKLLLPVIDTIKRTIPENIYNLKDIKENVNFVDNYIVVPYERACLNNELKTIYATLLERGTRGILGFLGLSRGYTPIELQGLINKNLKKIKQQRAKQQKSQQPNQQTQQPNQQSQQPNQQTQQPNQQAPAQQPNRQSPVQKRLKKKKLRQQQTQQPNQQSPVQQPNPQNNQP